MGVSKNRGTPRKINMEPDNTPLENGKLSSKPLFSGSMLILGGVPQNGWFMMENLI